MSVEDSIKYLNRKIDESMDLLYKAKMAHAVSGFNKQDTFLKGQGNQMVPTIIINITINEVIMNKFLEEHKNDKFWAEKSAKDE